MSNYPVTTKGLLDLSLLAASVQDGKSVLVKKDIVPEVLPTTTEQPATAEPPMVYKDTWFPVQLQLPTPGDDVAAANAKAAADKNFKMTLIICGSILAALILLVVLMKK